MFTLLVSTTIISFLFPFTFLLDFSHDDSFYYLKTAQNICNGLGSTFDGISPTNGYHPLWLVITVLFFFIIKLFGSFPPETLYRLIFLLHSFICIIISLLVFKILSRLYEKKTAVKLSLLVLVLNLIFVFIRGVGIESIINCLILSLILFLKIQELGTGKIHVILKSILLSLLFLGRTDYLLSLIPALIIGDYFTTDRKIRNRNLVIQMTFVIIVSFCYYAFNYALFGHFGTISSVKLNTFPRIVLVDNLENMTASGGIFSSQMTRLLFLFVMLVFVSLRSLFGKNESREFRSFTLYLLSAGYGLFVFCLIHLCFNSEGLREWYLTLPLFDAVLLSSYLLVRMINYWKIIFTLFLIIAAIVIYKTRIDSDKFSSVYEYSRLLSREVRADEPVYQVDFAGMLGFFSERKVVNGDGFINSFEYYDMIKNGKLIDYFDKYGIELYSTYTMEKKVFDSLFIDDKFAIKGSGFSFSFPRKNLIMTSSFDFKHLQGERKGNWYLFKIEK